VSVESKKLKPFETNAIKNLFDEIAPDGARKPKDFFESIELDGVALLPNGNLAVVEVALGGGAGTLKAGPARKMLADALKLVSAHHFLKDKNLVIQRRLLVVRNKAVATKIQTGWKGGALGALGVEVVAAQFSEGQESEAEIGKILKKCVEEQVEGKI
jgi:hypothetical protein